MNRLLPRLILPGFVSVGLFSAIHLPAASVNVTQHHNHDSRDGLYVDRAFTQAAAAGLSRDTNFSGIIAGNVYAQPLYIEDGPGGRAMIIVVTETNNVYALDAAAGTVIWQRNVGAPVPLASLPCGNIDPLGITGTPVVDLNSRTLVFDAMTTPNGGTTKRHLLYALNVDTGTTNAGWPVDLNATARYGTNVFNSTFQNQRSAVCLMQGTVYVVYSGHAGDCLPYFGWVVAVPLNNPTNVMAWATTARGGGCWAVGGVANDGTNVYVATGNTFSTGGIWGGGEAIVRFEPGLGFSTNQTQNYWAPPNWLSLDNSDTDIGGSGPVLVDVPGATPRGLVVALGKDGNAYLLNRTNLGGISSALASAHLSSTAIIQAAATYRTALGTYVVFCGNTSQNQLSAFRIGAANPPTLSTNAWSRTQSGRGSPFVTSTDGTNNVVVWGLGAESSQRLIGLDGDTGNIIFNGGGVSELMGGIRRFNTGIAARGRIYVAGNNRVYAFTLPVAPIVLTDLTLQPPGQISFGFTNNPGMSFSVFSTTNLSVPWSNWTRLGFVPEISPGHFQFTDTQVAGKEGRFYRVRSP